MTLVELLVYMVLAALVLTPVIMLMNSSSISMARDAGRVNLQMSGREIMQLMYDDLKNTGFKIWPNGGDFGPDTTSTIFFTGIGKFCESGTKCCGNAAIGCNPDPCPAEGVEYRKDSSSFLNGNSYILRWSSSTGAWVYLYPNATGCSSSPSCLSLVSRYDTLEVRMGKLDKNGLWEGEAAYTIKYNVRDTSTNKFFLIRTIKDPKGNENETVLARNVAALKFRFSDNLKDWYDYFDKQNIEHIKKKMDMQYIKVILVLRDPKKLAATKNQSIELIAANDGVGIKGTTPAYYRGSSPAVTLTPTDQALYEKYEMVVPIPNNGLFP